jgi:hypothetical protein
VEVKEPFKSGIHAISASTFLFLFQNKTRPFSAFWTDIIIPRKDSEVVDYSSPTG